ncbi:orotidine 5'-phosphate decarboxylase [Apilactobacillus kunkeei]|uniref:orotidine-5'-phosphate decarboxylase n=1 Tax=Apilactobacillus kunkeei TaxID=148814 RepID=UPI00059B2A49|nr:orotidine-5'-phosphate decarboxylase [Apilactobacillus kunkeei]KIM18300.1 orotidine 5'-phosphate decarboxylase [Apilactobacillus kunkeei]MBX8454857.1 orotidine-5'-phosphate decarboxylase [Apilactobacillus kunkeei]QYU54409.1 orotidine-5'-phosphate decarboxylase [Apilactobacillus kunkeei]CAI2664856.1 Orotidine 5'-phosphate decarboxylase [Apilactobacillus kunkeei]CAI2667146.1 Orotidine 5'-phosphate decarboxylase [Apilactobacillus kunkeei]
MKPVFIALDFVDAPTSLKFLEPFKDVKPLAVKVGMELFYREGASIIRALRNQNIDVFLDLKLHDIPHTVQQASKQIGQLDVQFTTVHSLGGSEMIKAARRGLEEGADQAGVDAPQLLAVTQLTSTSEEQLHDEELVPVSMEKSVSHLAKMASQSGADGVISSALENNMIHQAVSDEFKCINPGIRLPSNSVDDQKRVVTPTRAFELNTSGIVVGRSITQSNNPVQTYKDIYNAVNGGIK